MKTTYRRNNLTLTFKSIDISQMLDLEELFPNDIEVPRCLEHFDYVVKNEKDEACAYVSYTIREKELILTQFYVTPGYRHLGIGTKVMDVLSSLVGVDFIRVISTPGSAGFYGKLGFELDAGQTLMTKALIQ